MHYYQHHIGDFIKDTTHLDDHQLAAYLRMLWAYYTSESPITADFEDVAFAMRSDEKTVRLLLRHFFIQLPDGWHHTRCEREISEYRSKAEKARNSANARWKNAEAVRPHSERIANASVLDANQEPITNNQEPINTPLPPPQAAGAGTDGRAERPEQPERQHRSNPQLERFERFWQAYPRKVGKDAARKAFEKRKPDEGLLVAMLSTVAVQRSSVEWVKDGGQYVPNPATWLNQGRWQDELPAGGSGSSLPDWMRGAI